MLPGKTTLTVWFIRCGPEELCLMLIDSQSRLFFYLGICFIRISEWGKWSLKITLSKIKFNLLFKVWYWCQSILVNRELPDAAADPAFWVPDCVLGIWDDYCMHGILPRGQARNLQDIFSHVGFSSQGQKTIKDCWDKYFNVVFWVP